MKRAMAMAAITLAGWACGEPPAPPDAPQQPTGFTFEAVGDRSFISVGWTGLTHDIATPDGMPFGVKVTGCTSPTGACTFTGPEAPQNPVNRKRCLNHMRQTCQSDGECTIGDVQFAQCVFIYDVPAAIPQPGNNGNKGGCAFSFFAPAARFNGSFDLGSGELNIQGFGVQIVQNGTAQTATFGNFRGTCMECMGDTTPNDGKQDGRCKKITRAGQNVDPSLDVEMPCDVHRYGNLRDYTGAYSMDCSPTMQRTDPILPFGATLTSSGFQIQTNAASPNCSDPAFAGEKCFCAMCADNATACTSNADCGGAQCGAPLPANCDLNPMPLMEMPVGSGILVTNPAFVGTSAPMQCKGTNISATRPNSCLRGDCTWDKDTGTGTCMSLLTGQPVGCFPRTAPGTVNGVGALVRAPGGTHRSPNNNVWVVDSGFARCAAAQTPAFNGQIGLPGLSFQKRSFRVIPEYAP